LLGLPRFISYFFLANPLLPGVLALHDPDDDATDKKKSESKFVKHRFHFLHDYPPYLSKIHATNFNMSLRIFESWLKKCLMNLFFASTSNSLHRLCFINLDNYHLALYKCEVILIMLHGLNIFICLFFSINIYSQSFVYSKDYFRWPVDDKPGIVANFGELRSNHWHMGLDVRTDQKVNMPVYAAADGYVAKITVQAFGYGQAIYINHPNGLTTVYGHLNKFFSRLDSVVTSAQYEQQSWEIEINFTKDQFPVRKGQLIALSGSTGGSQGPHVHFEIRNTTTQRCINPYFFNLPIQDDVPPVFTKLALYNRTISIYDQSPTVIPVKKIKDKYLLRDTLIRTSFSKVGFAVGAFDRVTGSSSPNGIYSGKIFLDEQPLSEFVLDSMDYNETEYVNAHVDYKYRYNGGSYLQLLFKLPGDNGRTYRLRRGDGSVILNDTNIHNVRIEISDVKQNTSELKFNVKFSSAGIPVINNSSHNSFSPGSVNIFEQDDFEAYLDEECLYDSVQPVFTRVDQAGSNSISSSFRFGDASIPLHTELNIRIKPNSVVAEELTDKIVIKRTDGESGTYRRAEWQKGWVAAKFSDFGSFQAFADTTTPSVNGLGSADTIDLSPSKRIAFYPKDNSGVRSFWAELDGKWLMFTNDKGAAWVYNFDEHCPYGVHRLKVRIVDIVGNVTEKDWCFKRYPYSPLPTKTAIKKKASSKKNVPTRMKSTKKK
jgi:peptidase M23-like protein